MLTEIISHLFPITCPVFWDHYSSTFFGVWASAEHTAERLVEEGWRYNSDLKVKVIPASGETAEINLDFQMLHSTMAYTIEASTELAQEFFGSARDKAKTGKAKEGKSDQQGPVKEEDKSEGDKVLTLFRFTGVYQTAEGLKIGDPITLPSTLFDETPVFSVGPSFIPTQETIFVSGWCPFYDNEAGPKTATGKFVTLKDGIFSREGGAITEAPKKAEKMFSMLPPFHPEKPQTGKYTLATRFVQRNYIDPWLFTKSMVYLYGRRDDFETILLRGNYSLIEATHAGTFELLKKREEIVKQDFQELLKDTLESDVIEALKKFEDLKRAVVNFMIVPLPTVIPVLNKQV